MDRADARRGSAKIGSGSGASRAVAQRAYGPPDVLELGTIPTAAPGQGEVLVRVRAASINARDWHVMRHPGRGTLSAARCSWIRDEAQQRCVPVD